MVHIIFDIGGTKMRVARKINNEEFTEPIKVETPSEVDEGARTLFELAEKVAEGEEIRGMSGGIAAVFDEGTISNSSNLKGWIGLNFDKISKEKGFPIIVKNDSAVVGLGEAYFGAGKGSKIVTYITVSTGVGGARIVSGKIDENSLGFEPGQQIINYKELVTLENLVSGRSLELRFNKKPYEIIEKEVWEEAARILAVGLHNTIVHWSPDIVVLGGPMMVGSPSIPLGVVRAHLDKTMHIFKKSPRIVLADLQDEGGLYGALVLSH